MCVLGNRYVVIKLERAVSMGTKLCPGRSVLHAWQGQKFFSMSQLVQYVLGALLSQLKQPQRQAYHS